MEANERSSTEVISCKPKKRRHPSQTLNDSRRNKTRINIGKCFETWRCLRDQMNFRTDAVFAKVLLDSYKRSQGTSTPSNRKRPTKPAVSRITEDSDRDQDVLVNHSELGVQRLPEERETSPLEAGMVGDRANNPPELSVLVIPNPTVIKSEPTTQHDPAMPVKLPVEKSTFADQGGRYPRAMPFRLTLKPQGTGRLILQLDTDPPTQRPMGEQEPTKPSEHKETRVKEEAEEEIPTTLSVGDKCYPVDLGSPSEFIVDEECLLELFRSCRKCNQRCIVQKDVDGLKIVVIQSCGVCQSRFEWTNLPEEDERPPDP